MTGPRYEIAGPAELLALVERLAQEYLTGPGINPRDLNSRHPVWAAISAEIGRALPHQAVEVDFAYHHFYRGLWHIGMEQGRDDEAQHVVVNIADYHFEDRAMTMPVRSLSELNARIEHAKRMVLEDSFYGDEAGIIGFLETIGADFSRLYHGGAR